MKALVFGAGFIGTRLASSFPGAMLSKADICDEAAVAAELRRHRPDAVINAAGKTGHPNVDWCESHPAETARSNVRGAITLAECCQREGVYLIHLGSGCIFYGPSPHPGGWREDDFANPISTYSRSKYAADLVLGRFDNVAIARLRMPIDHQPGPRNLITKLAGYPKVVDVENSVSVVEDVVEALVALAERRATGVFHLTNPGILRHRELLALYRERVDPTHRFQLIDPDELLRQGLVLKGRSNCLLQSPRLEALGIRLRPIEDALAAAMERYAELVPASRSGGLAGCARA